MCISAILMGLSWEPFRENSWGEKQWLIRVNLGAPIAMDEGNKFTPDRQMIEEWNATLWEFLRN
jgi:hypothetical protein